MSTSAIEPSRLRAARAALVYLAAALLCAALGAVYELFSHGVYSYFMLYAFLFPLAGGALPLLALSLSRRPFPGRLAFNLYNSGIAAWTVGSFFQGVLEIYGTTNRLTLVYWWAGAAFVAAGLALSLLPARRRRGPWENRKPQSPKGSGACETERCWPAVKPPRQNVRAASLVGWILSWASAILLWDRMGQIRRCRGGPEPWQNMSMFH